MGRAPAPAAGLTLTSLQCGLPFDHQQEFEQELQGWFPALKWLIKEFRLQVGYETPDEEAGVRFWIDRYRRRRGAPAPTEGLPSPLGDWSWPTADEPSTPATEGEVAQARRWDQRDVERQLERFFELRRELCPETPVLVPLQQRRVSRKWSLRPPRVDVAHAVGGKVATGNEFGLPSATPVELKRSASRSQPEAGPRRPGRPRQLPQEVQDRLFPTSAACGGALPLSDEQFASRVVDLAIEFDGHADHAARCAQDLITTGRLPEGEAVLDRRWVEGRSQLEELGLIPFWVRLPDKAALGLMVPVDRAERLLKDRARGATFAQGVFQVFHSRFRYECLDAGVLYRFWLSLPTAVRSAHHVRGTPDHEAFELLRLEARARAERRRAAQAEEAAAPAAHAGARPPWRPGGEAAAQGAAPLAPAPAPVGGRGTGLAELAQPRWQGGSLPYLKALLRRFPRDLKLQSMVRQSLGSGAWRPPVQGDMRDVSAIVRYLSGAAAGDGDALCQSAAAGRSPKLLGLADQSQAPSLQQALVSLQHAEQVTKSINARISKTAMQYLKKGARVGPFGAYFSGAGPRAQERKRELRGRALVEDLFAQLCREFGAADVLERFGPAHYMPAGLRGARGPRLTDLLSGAERRGGAVACCKPQAVLVELMRPEGARQPAAGAGEVEGDPGGAWRPHPPDLGFMCCWSADLGGLHSCVGVLLDWSLQQRHVVTYPSGPHLCADLRLQGGLGAPVQVVSVSPGGAAAAAGVAAGDVLHLEAGSREEDAFRRLSMMDALTCLPGPLRFAFDKPGGGPLPTFAAHERPAVKVRIWAARDDQDLAPKLAFEQGQAACDPDGWVTEPVSTEHPSRVPAVFVGGRVRIEIVNWPQVGGQALHLRVRIVKVWKLAPPAFQRRFVESLRQRAEKLWRSDAKVLEKGCPPRGFWSSSAHRGTFNRAIRNDIDSWHRSHHDGDVTDVEMLKLKQRQCLQAGVNERTRSGLLQSEKVALRLMIYGREDDARECTFHPRAAANVPDCRFHPSDPYPRANYQRYDNLSTVADFAKRIDYSSDTNAGPYPNYQLNLRRKKLNLARIEYSKGSLSGALTKLRSGFGLTSIRDRFTCQEQGCGMLLDTNPDASENPFCGRCTGYFCAKHLPLDLHDCEHVKRKMVDRKIERKDKNEEEETFDAKDKASWGLLLEVHRLVEQIYAAQRAKRQRRRSLELLGQSLVQFGAVRLLERPFRSRMCQKAVALRRSASRGAGRGVAPFGRVEQPAWQCCDCESAHHPAELRFPAGESAVRRAAWVTRSIHAAKQGSDARPGSALARGAERKANEEREKARPQAEMEKRRQRQRASQNRRAASANARREALSAADEELPGGLSAELTAAARMQMLDGDLDAARESLNAAKDVAVAALADGHLRSSALRGSGAGEPEAEAATAASRDLLGQIRALAAKAPAPRPLRDCERAALARRGAAAASRARGALAACADLEAQVAAREQGDRAAPARDVQVFRPGEEEPVEDEEPDSSLPGPAATAPAAADEARTQMCAELLEAGRCSRGRSCPFGHHPGQLARRSRQSLEELSRLPVDRAISGL